MRLIDADELKECFRWSEVCRLSISEINKIIDNAPTVEINTNDIEYKAYCKGLEDGKKIARPQGEWIDVPCDRDLLFNTGIKYTCSACGKFNSNGHSSFCPNCGADMRIVG